MHRSPNQDISLQRLHSMDDWLDLGHFNPQPILRDLKKFEGDWRPYNPRKPNNRFGLSVTSLDGELSGVPDLDSLSEYNREHGTSYNNLSFTSMTPVFTQSPALQELISPFLPWLGRCHFIKLNSGGFFPKHYDINKTNFEFDEIRLIYFVKNCGSGLFNFCYEDKVISNIQDGDLYYFNASKVHSVFSFTDDSIQLIFTLRFDPDLFKLILDRFRYS